MKLTPVVRNDSSSNYATNTYGYHQFAGLTVSIFFAPTGFGIYHYTNGSKYIGNFKVFQTIIPSFATRLF